jgi:cell division protein FtsA
MLSKLKSVASKLKDSRPSTPAGNYILALDIGTEYVKALIAKVEPNSCEIVGVGRAHQELSDMQAGAVADIAGVVENCRDAISEAESQAGVQVRTTVIGIAGELVKGQTLTIKFKRADPKKSLELEEMEAIIAKAQKRSEQSAQTQIDLELGTKDSEIKLVNSALVGISIDGYKVTNPIGFQGKEVSVQLYSAFAPLVHIGAIEKVAMQLNLDLLAVATEPFAVGRAMIGDDANTALSAVLVDVGGGTTDIAVLNEGGLAGTKMFGIGGRAYTKSIARDLNLDFHQAENLKLSYHNNRTSVAANSKIDTAINKTLDVWIEGVGLALDEFDTIDHLPHKILLCGGGASLPELVSKLNTTSWYSDLPFTRKPIIQLIKPEEVVGIVDSTGSLKDHTYITAMGLLRVGCDSSSSIPASASASMAQKINKLFRI